MITTTAQNGRTVADLTTHAGGSGVSDQLRSFRKPILQRKRACSNWRVAAVPGCDSLVPSRVGLSCGELLGLVDAIREVWRRDIELAHAGMQPLERSGVVGW
jgi:hypothetical protein